MCVLFLVCKRLVLSWDQWQDQGSFPMDEWIPLGTGQADKDKGLLLLLLFPVLTPHLPLPTDSECFPQPKEELNVTNL